MNEEAGAKGQSHRTPRPESLNTTASSTIGPENDQLTHNESREPKMAEEAPPDPDLEALDRSSTTASEVYTVFTRHQKYFIVFVASFAGMMSPFAGNIYFPALNQLASDLHVTSELINLTLTSYLIFQAISPTIMGDLADMFGRRPVYILCFVIFLAANIGLALQDNYAALLVLRCIQSAGSSGTVALGFGTVADVSVTAERGTYIGIASSGFLVGSAIGPIIGGLLVQYLRWPSIFWFLVIFSGTFFIIILVAFPETARNVVGNGSIPPPSYSISLLGYLHQRKRLRQQPTGSALSRTTTRESERAARKELANKRQLRWPNPLRAIRVIVEKDVFLLMFFNGLVYTTFYCVIASLPSLLERNYGFDALKIGLVFIPYGVGCMITSTTNGRLLDWNYRRIAAQLGLPVDKKKGDDLRNYPIEKARLQIVFPMAAANVILLIVYGWILDKNVHVAAVVVIVFFLGGTMNGVLSVCNTFLVDLYPESPSTATAANNLVRCLMGAGGTAAITPMIKAMGIGWCFTLWALAVVAFSPALWLLVRSGPRWREARRVRIERKRTG